MDSRKGSISEEETAGCYVKARYVLALMVVLGVINMFSLRNGITVAILKMVNTNPNSTTIDNETYTSECSADALNSSAPDYNMGEFDWNINQQTWVLGCYYYGNVLTNVPGALLAKRYRIKRVFGMVGLLSSAFTLLIPTCARLSFGLLIAARTFVGFLHGAMFPTLMTAWGIWAPPLERSRMLSFTFGAYSLGNCIVLQLAGFIVIKFDWSVLFYITGGAGLLWSILWLALIHDSPATHPRISENEKRYIEESLGRKQSEKRNKQRKIPWLKICSSPPVLGTVAIHIADNWATLGLTALAPMYIARVLQFDIKSAGILSSLPFLLRFIITFMWGFFADFIIATKRIPVIWIRRFSSSFPALMTGLSLVLVAYMGCNKWPVVILMAASVGILGMTASGHYSTLIDIAPVYAGVIYSISNTLNSTMGFLAPQLSGLLLVDNSLNSWKNVFWLAASISFAGGLAYALLVSDQVQDWARDPILVEEHQMMSKNEKHKETSWNEKNEEEAMLDVTPKKA